MLENFFPALYMSADVASNRSQKYFLRITKAEYGILIILAGISSAREIISQSHFLMAALLLALGGLLIAKLFLSLEKKWYAARALAESVKTTSWRFAMRAHPFDDADHVEIPLANFRNALAEILKSNKDIGELLENSSSEDQVTDRMLSTRSCEMSERLSFYIEERVDNQRKWYNKKARFNRRAKTTWALVSGLVYFLALASIFADDFGLPQVMVVFDPLLVLATSIIGWIQIKKHAELSASYSLTAHEIGIIRARVNEVVSEESLSEFVNEAELAFSREHTQWAARKDAA